MMLISVCVCGGRGGGVRVSVCASMFPVHLNDSFAQCASGAVSMHILCGSFLCAVYTFSFIHSNCHSFIHSHTDKTKEGKNVIG